jgi:hypothetical protein
MITLNYILKLRISEGENKRCIIIVKRRQTEMRVEEKMDNKRRSPSSHSNHASSTHQQFYRDDLERMEMRWAGFRIQINFTSRLGMLSAHPQAPVVSKTTMRSNFLQSFQVLAKLGVNSVRKDLGVLAIDDILLSVQEPSGDFELGRVLDNSHKSFEFIGVEITSASRREPQSTLLYGKGIEKKLPFVKINVRLFADQVGVTATNTLDFCQGEHDFTFPVDIGIQKTENMLVKW